MLCERRRASSSAVPLECAKPVVYGPPVAEGLPPSHLSWSVCYIRRAPRSNVLKTPTAWRPDRLHVIHRHCQTCSAQPITVAVSRTRAMFYNSAGVIALVLHVGLLLSSGGMAPRLGAAFPRVHQKGPQKPFRPGQGSRPSSCGQPRVVGGRRRRILVEAACSGVVRGCCPVGKHQEACWEVGTCRAPVRFAVDPSVPEEGSWAAGQEASAGLAA